MALRVAVTTGNIDRARQAAERLFGLRLDTETQITLSGQMHQLGLHELAEAVLGRARRRAGNKATALVGLMLQYQRQSQARRGRAGGHADPPLDHREPPVRDRVEI